MAIQQIEKAQTKGTQGGTRKINDSAVGMIMDVVQVQQYQKPIESTVRELTANAIDAQSEKDRALEILSGKAKPEDYFIERKGELYEDSKWDPSYYNLDHLSEKNEVELIYVQNEGVGRCDKFIVRDYGVGIGKHRLEGVVSVGFSTKRNRKDALGSFGVGAKVGLATGSDYYTLTTVYNGVKYILQVFSRKINSTIGPINLETGEQNPSYTFSDGYVIYGEKTDEKNYTEVSVPSLRHYKQKFVEAVRTQLLYFKNVKFNVIDETGYSKEISFNANVIYNSDNLIIADSTHYSKPHVVIVKGGDNVETQTGVCYGQIDFEEMELNQLYGDIGIKCPIRQVTTDENGQEIVINEGVDVVVSRENIRWTQATKDFLKKRFEDAQNEATSLIEKELKDSDFIKWLESCKSITSLSGRSGSVIGRLSKIVDIRNSQPKFAKTKIQFRNIEDFFRTFTVKHAQKYFDKETAKYKVKLSDDITWDQFYKEKFYFKTEKSERLKNLYLADQHDGSFMLITPKENLTEVKLDKKSKIYNPKEEQDEILSLLFASEYLKKYDSLVVPEEYIESLNKIEAKAEEEQTEAALTPAEKRKLEEKVVCNTLVSRYNSQYTSDETYQSSKREPKYKEIDEYKGDFFYGFTADKSKLHFAAHILDVQQYYLSNRANIQFWNKDVKLCLISKTNKKYFKSVKHIDSFFGEPKLILNEKNEVIGKEIKMNNSIVKWNTARKLQPIVSQLEFLTNYKEFSSKVQEDYLFLVKYVKQNYADLTQYQNRFGVKEHYNDFISFLDKIEKIQELSENDKQDQLIDFIQEQNLPEGLNRGLAVDRELLQMSENLLNYVSEIAPMLRMIGRLYRSGEEFPQTQKMALIEYLEWKNVNYVELKTEDSTIN